MAENEGNAGEGKAGEGKAERRLRKERRGVVVATKMTKTVTVMVTRRVKHAEYGKYRNRQRKFLAHDTLGCKEGDIVRIEETRPMSKTKRWRVVAKLEKGA
jgi:small subunit ribosomal protein S17